MAIRSRSLFMLPLVGAGLVAVVLAVPHTVHAAAQTPKTAAVQPADIGWRISPENINLEVGATRTLQALDDSGQELEGAAWSVDDDTLAELREGEDGRIIVQTRAPGTLRVTALIAGERRIRDIRIWPGQQMPKGVTTWGVHPIGRELGDIPAVPVDDAPNMYSLEQTPAGTTYLRAGREDGVQIWIWRMPGETRDVELVCGDWLGGAVISANRPDGYTLYAVDKTGAERWHYDATGQRKGLAISTDHVVYLLSRSADGTVVTVAGLDEASGSQSFEHALPVSVERYAYARPERGSFVCSTNADATAAAPIAISRLFINSDGYAYLAFTQRSTTFHASACLPGSRVNVEQVSIAQDDKLLLWKIASNGEYLSRTVQATAHDALATSPVATVSPTGELIPDGLSGVLLSIRRSSRATAGSAAPAAEELVYRIDSNGRIVYRFPLPKYTGAVHDEMVLGEREQAFATRGGTLTVFNVRTGQPLWTWDSQTSSIKVLMALANGGIAVQTPDALVEVRSSAESREIVKGQAMVDWRGNLYLKHTGS
jgi:outer membrane protein assembly factor BamB